MDNLQKYINTPTAARFINAWDRRCALLGGAMNTGKTTAVAIKTFTWCYFKAPVVEGMHKSKFLVVRHDYGAIEETIFNEFAKWFPKGDFTYGGKPLKAQIRREKGNGQFGVHADFTPISLKNLTKDQIKSFNVTGLISVESQEIPEELLMELYDRTGRFPDQYMPRMWYGDINYPDDMHWMYKRFILEKEKTERLPVKGEKPEDRGLNWELFRQPPIFFRTGLNQYEPNPDAEIPIKDGLEPNYDYWLEIIARGKDGEITQKVIGDFALIPDGTPVYAKEWDDKFIKEIEPIKGNTLLFALDPGLIFGLLVGQVANDGTLLILAELAPTVNTVITTAFDQVLAPILNTEIFPYLKGEGKIKTWGWRDQADKMDSHTGLDTGGLLKEKYGINIADNDLQGMDDPHKVGTKHPEHLVNVSAKMLKDERVLIHPRCIQLIAALKGKWCLDSLGKPDKGVFSHIGNCVVAGTMVRTPLGEVPIETLSVGDYVVTPFGDYPITHTMNRVAHSTVIVSAGDTEIQCTKDHPFYTETCVCLADSLQYMTLLKYNSEFKCQQLSTLYKNLTESSFIVSQKVTIKQIMGVLKAAICTGMYGNFIMGKFHQSISFITKITTSPIMILATSNCLVPANIRHTTYRKELKRERITSPMNYVRRIVPSGMVLPKAWRGTKNMAKIFGLTGKKKLLLASYAETNMRRFVHQSKRVIAQVVAQQKRGEEAELMTLTESANYAEMISSLINTQKLSSVQQNVEIKDSVKDVRVYDLTVKHAHMFYANDILVSNCYQYLCWGVCNVVDHADKEDKPKRRIKVSQ